MAPIGARVDLVPKLSADVERVDPLKAHVEKTRAVRRGGFFCGIEAGGKILNDRNQMKATHPALIAGEKAIEGLQCLIQTIPGYEDAVGIKVRSALSSVTVYFEGGRTEKLDAQKIKEQVSQHNPHLPYADIDKEVVRHFDALNILHLRLGHLLVPHYSARGTEEVLASSAGKKALAVTEYTPGLIQQQEAQNLVADANKGEHGMLSLIGYTKGTPEEKQKAVDAAIVREAYFIHLRDQLAAHIDHLNVLARKAPADKRPQLEGEIGRFSALQDKLLTETNRRALWAHAIYQTPEECYGSMLRCYYEELYGAQDPNEKPSFEQFCKSPSSRPFRQRAAETASLMIVVPADYKEFCGRHEIEPNQPHINRFLHQAFTHPDNINFRLLGLKFSEEEGAQVSKLAAEAVKAGAAAGKGIQRLAKGKSAEQRLKIATQAKERLHIYDRRTDLPWNKRVARWMKDRFS